MITPRVLPMEVCRRAGSACVISVSVLGKHAAKGASCQLPRTPRLCSIKLHPSSPALLFAGYHIRQPLLDEASPMYQPSAALSRLVHAGARCVLCPLMTCLLAVRAQVGYINGQLLCLCRLTTMSVSGPSITGTRPATGLFGRFDAAPSFARVGKAGGFKQITGDLSWVRMQPGSTGQAAASRQRMCVHAGCAAATKRGFWDGRSRSCSQV